MGGPWGLERVGPVEVSGAEPHGQTPNQERVGAEGVRTLGDVPVTDTCGHQA